ncbi:hypothetical protein [Vulcanisaeta distributa]|uniref:hypothetical protein n=1 Tax=Vulcanisaeta distributa TaxID=164451 RepID=UPI000AED9733|nr:hypothetical protein [Vulcanisaeta distributa]
MIILEIEGRVAGGYSTRDFNANELRKLFSRAWVDVRLSLERRVGEGERSIRVFGGINEIIRQALKSRLGNDELVSAVMDIIERVRADDEDGALKTLENLVGVPLRGGSKSITDWLGVKS